MSKFMSTQLLRNCELQNLSNGDDFMGYGRILFTSLSYLCTLNKYSICNFILCTRIKKYTLIWLHRHLRHHNPSIGHDFRRYRGILLIPLYIIYVPKRKTVSVILFYVPASKSTLQYGQYGITIGSY